MHPAHPILPEFLCSLRGITHLLKAEDSGTCVEAQVDVEVISVAVDLDGRLDCSVATGD